MAEQDEPQTGKPDTPPSAPARPPSTPDAEARPKPGSGSLSAAAEAAAAKIEASILASRAAEEKKEAEAKQALEAKRAAAATKAAAEKKTAEAKPVAAPATKTVPASEAAPASKSAQAGSPAAPAVKPAAKRAAQAGNPAAPAVKPAGEPVAKPKAQEPEEVEDIIAMIPLEPRPGADTVSISPATNAPAPGNVEKTQALPRPAAAAPGAGSPPQTASAIAEARSRVFGAYNPGPEPTPAARERRAARQAALEAKPPLARTLQVLLAVFYPLILLIAAIRLIASPIFLWFDYQRPGFPADGFGFSTADRMTYGSYGVDFLNNIADNRYLGELRDPAGNPLFLGTEVQHMADVKNVMSFTYLAWAIMGVIVIFSLAYLGKRYSGGIRRGLFAGSVATLILLAGLTTAAILGWEKFFTTFHEIFFSQGNWTFNYSDTLIRLYPSQFWVDAAIAIGALVVITSLLTLIFTWPTARRRETSRLRQDSRVFGL
ncbi:TIGR01906 family membrane protein [Paeniglutamicibacter antarcticus]|uniref:TIGR01906 family membrane protein n=1 Tax=Paeniglutamicibacter antarcticus TaxID=494023 RepID=A0ABP9TNJ8_9MICC